VAYRVAKAVLPEWRALAWAGGWTDTFIVPVSPKDGLPPTDQALMLRGLARYLAINRPGASLWIRLEDCPGTWFAQVLREGLDGLPLPVAVIQGQVWLELQHFHPRPWLTLMPELAPEQVAAPVHPDLNRLERAALRVLARVQTATTREVAGLVYRSPNIARDALKGLEKKNLVHLKHTKHGWRWSIRRSGLSLALRSWHMPSTGMCTFHRERRAPAGRRHMSASRTWAAWLKHAWPGAEVWGGWSELSLPGRMYPDGLAWGRLDGAETLFWLEVESGHLSIALLQAKIQTAMQRAAAYAGRYRLQLVFCLLAQPWSCRVAAPVFTQVPDHVAVVLQDWKRFGRLPRWDWGAVTIGDGILSDFQLASSQYPLCL